MKNMINSVTTIPRGLMKFLDDYQHQHSLESRSVTLAVAIQALHEQELREAYKELGHAQQSFPNVYSADNADGLDIEDSRKWQW